MAAIRNLVSIYSNLLSNCSNDRFGFIFFLYKAIDIHKNFVSLHRFLNNAEAQGWRLRDGNLYIGKALLDALCLTFWNLAVP